VLGIGETAEAEMITNGAQALNGVLKEWSGAHTSPWRFTNISVPTVASQNYVSLTGSGVTNIMAILKATIATVSTRSDVIPLEIKESTDHFELQNDTTDIGKPVYGAIPSGGSSDIQSLLLSPIPDKVYYIDVEVLRPFQDFGAGTDAMQMSSTWGSALIYATAAELCHEYSCPMNERQTMRQEAIRTLKIAKLSTRERPTNPVRSGYY
jgi:hypothetical protein